MSASSVCPCLFHQTLALVYKEQEIEGPDCASKELFIAEAHARLGNIDCAKTCNKIWAETLNRAVLGFLGAGSQFEILQDLGMLSDDLELPQFRVPENLQHLLAGLSSLAKTVFLKAETAPRPKASLLLELTRFSYTHGNMWEGQLVEEQIKEYAYKVSVRKWYGAEASNFDVSMVLTMLPHLRVLDLRGCERVSAVWVRHQALSEILAEGSSLRLENISWMQLPSLRFSGVKGWRSPAPVREEPALPAHLAPKQRRAVEQLRALREVDTELGFSGVDLHYEAESPESLSPRDRKDKYRHLLPKP